MRLARHTVFNLIGLGAPLLAALVTIPLLIDGLGVARFGLLTLIWAVTSYFGLFDLGLGRALTQALAPLLTRKAPAAEVTALTRTALGLMALLGLLGGLLLALLAPWALRWVQEVPDAREAVRATWCLAAVLPLITLTAGQRGALEACHAFGVINLIRVPMGLWTFVSPWIALQIWGPDLVAITALLAAGRVLGWLAHAGALRRALPQAQTFGAWSPDWLRPLLRAGGWLTLSNVVSPLMGYLDRFAIAALLSAAAVTYYATPYEIVTKLWIVPGALVAVLLPRFAAQGLADWPLHGKAVETLFWVLLPVCAGLALFAEPLLAAWLRNPELVRHSAPLLAGFALGILVNCLAHVPLTWLHAQGSFRAPALLHLAELPVFALALAWLIPAHGLTGALAAWLLRISVDTLGMFWLAARQAGQALRLRAGPAQIFGLLLALLAWPGGVPAGVAAGLLLLLATIAAFRLPALWRGSAPD